MLITPQLVDEKVAASLATVKMTTIVTMLVGSRCFGFSKKSSDYDIRVLGMPDEEYFQPNKRSMIVGFDPMIDPRTNTFFNVIIPEEPPIKYDVFMDSLPNFLQQSISGGYYQLQNLMLPLNDAMKYDPRWVEFHASINATLPASAFIESARVAARDVKAWLMKCDEGSFQSETEGTKRAVQGRFVTNFLKHRDPLDKSVDYPALRDSLKTIAQAKEVLLGCLDDLRQLIADGVQEDPDVRRDFKNAMMSGMNSWYGKELFTLQ